MIIMDKAAGKLKTIIFAIPFTRSLTMISPIVMPDLIRHPCDSGLVITMGVI